MKELTINKAIAFNRREKKLTQEDLATFIGVSKASVSKWETGQSYPDITFLPQLATYFNISIDELIGYEPQMTKEDIRKLYTRLSTDFSEKPFEEVLENCRELAKKYFSCFPLLFQMATLLLNHCNLLENEADIKSLLLEIQTMFSRVKNESEDMELAKQALLMEAYCAISLNQPEEALILLEGTTDLFSSTEVLLATAYQMTGRITEAKSVLQVGSYTHLMTLFDNLSNYLSLATDEPEVFDEIQRRILALVEIFDIKSLHPSVLLPFYLRSAQGYITVFNNDKALSMLEKYTDVVTGNIYPIQLKGDNFFSLLDSWFADLPLGISPPRNEKIIRESMYEAVVNNPVFQALSGDDRFSDIQNKLKNNF